MLVVPLTLTPSAADEPNRTVAPLAKFAPVIVTMLPPPVAPVAGLIELMVGGAACAASTVNVPFIFVWPTPHEETVQMYVNGPGTLATNEIVCEWPRATAIPLSA